MFWTTDWCFVPVGWIRFSWSQIAKSITSLKCGNSGRKLLLYIERSSKLQNNNWLATVFFITHLEFGGLQRNFENKFIEIVFIFKSLSCQFVEQYEIKVNILKQVGAIQKICIRYMGRGVPRQTLHHYKFTLKNSSVSVTWGEGGSWKMSL